MKVTLLGPQRRPTLDKVAASLNPGGPVATITAGWQEREPDDDELSRRLGDRDVNLALYRRWLDVQERDQEFAAAAQAARRVLDELQDIYLLRLDYALRAVYAIQRRNGRGRLPGAALTGAALTGAALPGSALPGAPMTEPALHGAALAEDALTGAALTEALTAVRELDAAHLRRVGEVRGEFYQAWRPQDRPVIAGHRAAVAGMLGDAAALVIAGGHVGVLADVLHLFNVGAGLRSPVIAWSAGAMALTDRIVLFHDRAPQGPGHPEIYGSGLGLVRDLVALPHARARMLLDDAPRMAVFARRFAPARCVLLEAGTRVDTGTDGGCPPDTRVLAEDGRVTSLEAA